MADLVEDGKAKAAGIVSIMIAVFALGELICGFMLFGYGNTDGSGVWSGFGLAIVAVLGIVAWVKKNKTVMVFFLVLSILWFIVSIVQVVIGFLGWVIYSIFHEILKDCTVQDGKCVCAEKSVPIDVSDCVYLDNIATIYMVVMILGALGAILLLSSSIIGCMGTCCASRTETNIVVVQQPGMVMQTHPPQYPVKAY